MSDRMDSADFIEAMNDLDGNPDQSIVVALPVSGHWVDDDGSVYTIDGKLVGFLPSDVFHYRTQVASGL